MPTSTETTLDQLRSALERVDAATGPDREIDYAITALFEPERHGKVREWSASLNAVVALIEREHGPGVPIRIHIAAHWCKAFVGYGSNSKGECKRSDRQIALAVLWSYLQALIAEAEQQEDVA